MRALPFALAVTLSIAASTVIACSGSTGPAIDGTFDAGSAASTGPSSSGSPMSSSGSSSGASSGSSGSTSSSGGADASADVVAPFDAGPPCNAVPFPNNLVDVVYASPPTPPGLGGVIPDGTYILVGVTYYDDGFPPGTVVGSEGERLVLKGGSYESAYADSVGTRFSGAGTVSSTGNVFLVTATCPSAGDPQAYTYTWDGKRLSAYTTDTGATYERE